jgi:hypothetical protein
MTDIEFRDWLSDEVAGKRMTPAQQDDLMLQKSLFDLSRTRIQQIHRNEVVGYVGSRELSAKTVQELFAQAHQLFPKRMIYFEPIGFDLF